MEEILNPQSQIPGQSMQTGHGQPQPGKKNKKALAIVIFLAAVILIAGSVFFYLGKKNESKNSSSPTPEAIDSVVTEDTSTPQPSSTPETVDKSTISISILNGTGIPKEASFVQGILKNLGYTKFEVGNAPKQDYKSTEVTFKTGTPDSVKNEIIDALKKSYSSVKSSTSSSQTMSVQIITGLKTGQTPIATSTAKPSSTPKPSTTGTPTASPSSTPTATP